MKRFILILLACALLLCGCAKNENPVLMEDFSTVDLAGNRCDNSIFNGYKLTMINIWATYCGPCLSEMPALGKLHTEYASEGFKVVGIVADVTKADEIPYVQSLVAKTGANYTHLLPDGSMRTLLNTVFSVPTTYFVDENGRQVGEEYVGARSAEEWASIIQKLLEETA